jgi:hypothetical protein
MTPNRRQNQTVCGRKIINRENKLQWTNKRKKSNTKKNKNKPVNYSKYFRKM